MFPTMPTLTYLNKCGPSRACYGSLFQALRHVHLFRNACLQERIESYRSACRIASRNGRSRPLAEDWIEARAEEVRAYLVWQEAHALDLRRRYDQAEVRRVKKAEKRVSDGETVDNAELTVTEWRPKDASHFGRSISMRDQVRWLAEMRLDDPEGLGSIPLSVLREQADIVDKAMKAFFSRVAKGQSPGFPRFKSLSRVVSFSAPLGDGISLKDGKLRSMMWEGGIPVSLHRELPSTPTNVRLKYDGRYWWAGFTVEVDAAEQHEHPGTACGVDVGIERLATLDDGTFIANPRYGAAEKATVRRAALKLARAKRGSVGRRKAKQGLARVQRRVRNRRDTYQHVHSKLLAERFETIVVEDLKLRNMSRSASGTVEKLGVNVAQKRGLNGALLDAAPGAFIRKIGYKAERAGGGMPKRNAKRSSIDCSDCDAPMPKTLSDRRHICTCGADYHRDHNAARNMLKRLAA